MSLYSELKRRNVFRVALFYIVAAWLIVQVAETVLPLFDVPESLLRGVVVMLVIGFLPAVAVSWIYELTPEGLKRDSEVTEAEAAAAQASRKLNIATVVVAVLAIVFLVADRLVPREPAAARPAETSTEQVGPAGQAVAIQDASIAVLPFADLSPGGDQEYFSDGIAEEILNALVKVGGLEVASRTSSFGFKGQENLGIPTIADKLGVRHVLEGSVRRAGDTLRITAQLIDAQVDRHLWSETYDRPLTAENVFAIQEEIASSIVAALADSLGVEVNRDVALGPATGNFTAYDLYLQARSRFQARRDLDDAEELLVQALEQDPRFAKAWELRAALQGLNKEYGYSELPDEELKRRGLEYAQKALAIEPASGMALATIGRIHAKDNERLLAQHDFAGIIEDLRRAYEIDPTNSSALNWLGLVLGQVGRVEEALDVFQRCMDLDPLFAPCAENEYEALWVLGRPDEAYEHFQRNASRGVVTQEYVNFALLAHFGEKTAFLVGVNQSSWLQGWHRQEEVWEAYQHLAADHSALVSDLRLFLDREGGATNGYRENLMIPLGAYDMLPFPMLIWGPDYEGYRRSPQFENYIRQSGALAYWRAHGFPPGCRAVGEDGFACAWAADRPGETGGG